MPNPAAPLCVITYMSSEEATPFTARRISPMLLPSFTDGRAWYRPQFDGPVPVTGEEGIQGSAKWLERDNTFGASIAPALLQTFKKDDIAYTVLRMAHHMNHNINIEKSKYPPMTATPSTSKGHATEPGVLLRVSDDLGVPVLPGQVFYADSRCGVPRLRVSLDGELLVDGKRFIVESKSVFEPPNFGVFPDVAPDYWTLQCQIQLFATRADYAILATAYIHSDEWIEKGVREPVGDYWPAGKGVAAAAMCRGWKEHCRKIGKEPDFHQLYFITPNAAVHEELKHIFNTLEAIATEVSDRRLAPTVRAVTTRTSVLLSEEVKCRLCALSRESCTKDVPDEIRAYLLDRENVDKHLCVLSP